MKIHIIPSAVRDMWQLKEVSNTWVLPSVLCPRYQGNCHVDIFSILQGLVKKNIREIT